jgi:hypothetical protein
VTLLSARSEAATCGLVAVFVVNKDNKSVVFFEGVSSAIL